MCERSRLDQVDEDVPFVFLEDDGVPVFPNANCFAVDDDLRAIAAARAERVAFHRVPPSLMASSRGQMAAWRADVWSHLRSTVRIERESAVRACTLVFNRARTCLHG